ncbi:hypothetical protein K438DRAFT_1995106 [Mycena galopus ATCC 62051]|nr:hypothetical protein K438DRAFT_1995106 [Mycena galopus ATCC 62051]
MSTNNSEQKPLPKPELTMEENYKLLEKGHSDLVRNHGELHGRFVDLAADIKELAAEYNIIYEEYDRIVEEHEGLTVEHEKLKVKYNKLRTRYEQTMRPGQTNRPHATTSSPSVINPPPAEPVTLPFIPVWPIWTTLIGDTSEERRRSVMDKPCTCDPARWIKEVESNGMEAQADINRPEEDGESIGDTEIEDILRTFETPPQNASRDELLKALKDTQLKLAQAEVDLRAKDELIDELQKTGGKKSKGGAAENPGNYLGIIIPLGKKFGFMQEPWISPALFSDCPEEVPHATPDEVDTMFKNPKSYLQYLTTVLYEHVPEKHHELISDFPPFQDNFTKHLNVGRSSVISTLKARLDNILTLSGISKDCETLLYHSGQDTNLPPSSYPPIFYGGLKKDAKMLMLNKVGPMSLRCMIFGPSSIKNEGKGKPATNTVGYMWKLDHEGLTFGSIAFTLVALLFLLSGGEEDFQEKGKTSKIPFQTYFHTVGVRKIKQFWTKIVFAGVATADALEDEGLKSDGDLESDAEFAAAMEAMSMDGDGDEFETDELATQVAIRPPVHALMGPVQPNNDLVNNDENIAQQDLLPADTPENAGGTVPVVTSAHGGGRGRGRRGAPPGPVDIAVRGGRCGRGGRSVILSDEEQDDGDVGLVPVQPRRSSRRQ